MLKPLLFDEITAINSATKKVENIISTIIFNVVQPIAILIIALYILVAIVTMASDEKQGHSTEAKAKRLVILIIIAGILIGFKEIVYIPLMST